MSKINVSDNTVDVDNTIDDLQTDENDISSNTDSTESEKSTGDKETESREDETEEEEEKEIIVNISDDTKDEIKIYIDEKLETLEINLSDDSIEKILSKDTNAYMSDNIDLSRVDDIANTLDLITYILFPLVLTVVFFWWFFKQFLR